MFLVPELWHAQGRAIPQYLRIWVPASFPLWHQLSLPNIPQTQRSPEERGFLKYGVSLEEIILLLGACLYLSLHRCLISPILVIHDAASSDRKAFLVSSGSFKLGSSAQSRILPLKKVHASKVHAETKKLQKSAFSSEKAPFWRHTPANQSWQYLQLAHAMNANYYFDDWETWEWLSCTPPHENSLYRKSAISCTEILPRHLRASHYTDMAGRIILNHLCTANPCLFPERDATPHWQAVCNTVLWGTLHSCRTS